MTKKAILITVTGKDKPGLISALSGVVAAHDGNWLESRMANLGGQFAGMLRVEVSEDCQSELLKALEELDAWGLSVSLHAASNEQELLEGHDVELELLGQDHPGIVRDITQVLSANGISVQALDTFIEEASMAGGMLFHAHAKLRVPTHLTTEQLHEKLQVLSDSLLLDITLADFEPEG